MIDNPSACIKIKQNHLPDLEFSFKNSLAVSFFLSASIGQTSMLKSRMDVTKMEQRCIIQKVRAKKIEKKKVSKKF